MHANGSKVRHRQRHPFSAVFVIDSAPHAIDPIGRRPPPHGGGLLFACVLDLKLGEGRQQVLLPGGRQVDVHRVEVLMPEEPVEKA